MRPHWAALGMLLVLATASAAPAQEGAPVERPAPGFLPPGFEPPVLVEGDGFRIVPLGPALTQIDYAAYMSSIRHLNETFTRSTDWPTPGITAADAVKDMETEQARFRNRQSFAYAILTPDGKRERGCIYVYPSPVAPYDAMVRIWVTKAEYDAGFDAEIYRWTRGWIARAWPFRNVAYPGRAIAWEEWDALTARAKKGGAG